MTSPASSRSPASGWTRRASTTWPVARGTRSRWPRTWPPGSDVGSGRGSSSTCVDVDPSTTLPRPAASRCRSRSRRWPPTAWPIRTPRSPWPAAAAAAGIPFTLSTMSTRSIEEVAAAAPDGDPLVPALRPETRPHPRARRAGGGRRLPGDRADRGPAVLGYRERDRRNGFDLAGRTATSPRAGGTTPDGIHATDRGARSSDRRRRAPA